MKSIWLSGAVSTSRLDSAVREHHASELREKIEGWQNVNLHALATEYWDEEVVGSSDFDFDDGTHTVERTLSEADIAVISEALRRLFISKKRGRVQVVHAYKSIVRPNVSK